MSFRYISHSRVFRTRRQGTLVSCLMAMLFVVCLCGNALATDVTLSDEALLLLDDYYYSTFTARIAATRDVPGPGVEYDIQYQGTEWGDTGLTLVSSNRGGAGDFVGLDLSGYDHFSLEFTLLSVDGQSTSGSGGILGVGAKIGPWSGYGSVYTPARIGFRSGDVTNAISTSPTDLPDSTEILGWTAYFWNNGGWNPDGTLVTIRVAPTPGAVQIPEPTTVALLLPAALVVIRRSKVRRDVAN